MVLANVARVTDDTPYVDFCAAMGLHSYVDSRFILFDITSGTIAFGDYASVIRASWHSFFVFDYT